MDAPAIESQTAHLADTDPAWEPFADMAAGTALFVIAFSVLVLIYVFYAPAGELIHSPAFLELTLDEEWRAELDRRNRIITGRALPLDWARERSAQAVPYTCSLHWSAC